MRELQVIFFLANTFAMIVFGMYGLIDNTSWMMWVGFLMALLSLFVGLMLDGKKLHMKHDEMIAAEQEALIQIRNCKALIEEVKRQLFNQKIMTKQEVMDILDKDIENGK